MLIISPDPVELQQAVIASGGQMIGPEVARFGFFAIASDAAFAASMLGHGAWFVVDGRQIAALCGIRV
ncbi:hypothetical protein [uncultured Roseobacter sp.]|uniref:hypothetical protein n=1 Tax=uncultured Roseobacter sp. TaxID=114847 RepID=UPI00260B0B19|nr:hypothetical protein [uncultured Roseobacter sp.]